ncbi:DUF3035 domain-containing protein [Aerophototrophica crusticola]|uniref:DUF3035 domain-containing protein n=1 Tax=Aerophototrophica crusticola TaxID=1709002 RepID=A0A858R937_9PROT|nr:DUF3035 domain-containing protein [Rhodospirillaceae bacterium B3]
MGKGKVSRNALPVLALLASAAALSACSIFDRSSPDEFQVVARAPLEVPPDYNLRPPAPGTPRPQELDRDTRANASVFGAAGSTGGLIDPRTSRQQSNGEAALLSQAGADQANPDIRTIVDRENPGVVVGERSFLDRLLFWKDGEQPQQTVHQGAPPTIARTGSTQANAPAPAADTPPAGIPVTIPGTGR